MTPPERADECCPGSECTLLAAPEAHALSAVFKALADPTRIRLLQYLACSIDGTACACHLPDALGISQPTLSFHLHKLLDACLVAREKRGRWVHWTVRPESLTAARAFLALPAGDSCAPVSAPTASPTPSPLTPSQLAPSREPR